MSLRLATRTFSRAFRFSFESGARLSVFVFAAKRRVKGAAPFTSFVLEKLFERLFLEKVV